MQTTIVIISCMLYSLAWVIAYLIPGFLAYVGMTASVPILIITWFSGLKWGIPLVFFAFIWNLFGLYFIGEFNLSFEEDGIFNLGNIAD